jgi:hypothetical protein
MKLRCEKLSETIITGAQKYLAKRKLDSVGFIKAHSGIANRPERVQRMKSEGYCRYRACAQRSVLSPNPKTGT